MGNKIVHQSQFHLERSFHINIAKSMVCSKTHRMVSSCDITGTRHPKDPYHMSDTKNTYTWFLANSIMAFPPSFSPT